jgi:hypothetical protein
MPEARLYLPAGKIDVRRSFFAIFEVSPVKKQFPYFYP